MNAPIYYLRFLKPPPQEYNLGEPFTLVWTIESDLGDVTCFESIPVQCRLETAGKAKLAHCPKKALGWTEPTDKDITLVFDPFQGGGMVSQFRIEEAVSPGELRLHLFVNSSRSHPVWTGAGLYADLWLVPVWSRPIAVCKHERRRLASGGDQTERKLTLQSGSTLTVCEDAVESIARHVWDCGLGMCQYLQEHLSDFQRYQCLLELGSGTGLVGIYADQLLSPQKTFLTDLPDALEILQQNATLSGSRTVQVEELSWGCTREAMFDQVDLVLLTDVLYNQSSHDLLLDTLDWLLDLPHCKALLAYKERNPDERVFFDKVRARGWSLLATGGIDDHPMFEIYWLCK